MLKMKKNFWKLSICFFTCFSLQLEKKAGVNGQTGTTQTETISDELCHLNQFVRTFNQTNKELYTLWMVRNSSTISTLWNLTKPKCSMTMIVFEYDICTCEFNDNATCEPWYSIGLCKFNSTINAGTVTVYASQNITEAYQGTTIMSAVTLVNQSITLQECKVTSVDVKYASIIPKTETYGNQVALQCVNGSQLVVENIRRPSNLIKLTCGECGMWESYQNIYCVKVTLASQQSYKENTKADFNCTTNEKELFHQEPNYFLGGEVITGQQHSLSLTHDHHNKEVYCVVYLNNSDQSGIPSTPQRLNVTYQPYNTTTFVAPMQSHRHTPTGILLNDSQILNLTCIANANPRVNCIWNIFLSNISDNCHLLLNFNTSSNISCTAYNGFGSLASLTTQVLIVGPRVAQIIEVPNKTLEGDIINLSCVMPFAKELNTSYKWTVPNTINIIGLKDETLKITNVTPLHNGTYKCETNDDFGNYSAQIQINVIYQPYDVIINPYTSDVIIHNASNLFLRSSQNVTFNCTSDANPTAICSFSINDKTTTSDGSCEFQQLFNQSANVTCTASNEVNTTTSSSLQVAVVPSRTDIDADLSPTNSQPIEGEDLILDCSIPYQDELNTNFSWAIPSDRDLDKTSSIVRLFNLSRFDLGNYTCTTIDVFGQSSRTKFLNINYSPQKVEGQTTCNWNDVMSGSCHVIFTSNPKSEDFFIKQQDKIEPCPKCNFQSSHDDVYTQQFTFLLENAPEQTTFYQVHILSQNNLLQNLTVEFEVTVGDVINQSGLIVGCVVGGIALIVLAVGIILYYNRRKGNKTIKETNIFSQNGVIDTTDNYSTVEIGNQVDSPKKTKNEKKKKTKAPKTAKLPKTDEYAAVDLSKKKTKDSEKEERLNPLYGGVDIPDQITDAYDTVDVNKTQNEKEDRINPLYDVGKGNGVEEAYASVDKTKKKKKEKVGVVSGMQDAYADVDFDKKKKNKKNKKSKKAHVPSNEKEDKAEESQDAYATVDISKKKKKESSEKEDRLNPLYDMGEGNGVEDAYASVDKSAKRDTSEKEEKINPLYDSYQDQPSTSGSGNLDSLHANYSTTGMSDTYAVVDKQNGPSKKKQATIKPPVKKKPDIKPPTPTKPGALKPPKPKKPDIKKKPDLDKKEDD